LHGEEFTFVDTQTAADNNKMYSEGEPIPDDLPGLVAITDGEDEDDDDDSSDDDTSSPPEAPQPAQPTPQPAQPAKPATAGKGRITSFWKVETPDERAVRLEKNAREYAAQSEQKRLREVDEQRKKTARARVDGNERMRRHRERVRDAKIAEGWVPGQKRVSAAECKPILD
jgi:hypothetical protein